MSRFSELIPLLKSVQIQFRDRDDSYYHGAHGGLRRGSEDERSDYRLYRPGDEIRTIDWRLYSRTDRYFVREGRFRVRRDVLILADLSNSVISRLEVAASVILGALSLSYCLMRNHDRVKLRLLSPGDDYEKEVRREADLFEIEQRAESLRNKKRQRESEIVLPRFVRRTRSKVILLSDLYIPLKQLESFLSEGNLMTAGITLCQVTDSAILESRSGFFTRWIDSESGDWLPGNATDNIREVWEHALQRREQLARRYNAILLPFRAEEGPLKMIYKLEIL